MNNAYVVTGTLSNCKTLQLDEPLPISTGKVRIMVELVQTVKPKQAWQEVLRKISADQNARGHVPMSTEEVESHIKSERASWGDE